jgi:hypothetical protein
MQGRIGILVFGALFIIGAAFAASPQTPQELQTRFEQEPDVMRQAKLLIELSRADFHILNEQVAAGDNTDALKTLQQFVDDAQKCSAGLDAKEKNPESHPSGFKQLQIATRESLRRLDDMTVGLTTDEQAPFLTLRKSLDQLNRHLIHELFPHEPPAAKDSGASNSTRPAPEVKQ